MVHEDDMGYFLQRARQERRCAIDADCLQARLAHIEMASAYERRLSAAGVIVARHDVAIEERFGLAG